jgi:hypothetical protein
MLKLVMQQLLEALDTAHATGIGEPLWLLFGGGTGLHASLVWAGMWAGMRMTGSLLGSIGSFLLLLLLLLQCTVM